MAINHLFTVFSIPENLFLRSGILALPYLMINVINHLKEKSISTAAGNEILS